MIKHEILIKKHEIKKKQFISISREKNPMKKIRDNFLTNIKSRFQRKLFKPIHLGVLSNT